MKIKTISLLVFLLVALSVTQILVGQNSTLKKISPSGEKIAKDKPSVSLSYEKVGKRKPLREGESDEGIWLRLHNNTRGAIFFCAFGISEDGEKLRFYEKGGEIGVSYEVEKMPSGTQGTGTPRNAKEDGNSKNELSDIPTGYRSGSVCHVYTLPSNKSILFSVPREHLAKNLLIKMEFGYEWEGDYSSRWEEPQHYVRFYSSSLPENVVQP